VVMGSCMMHPELTAGVFGAACAHGICVGDVDLDEVAECQLLKSGPVLLLLCFSILHTLYVNECISSI